MHIPKSGTKRRRRGLVRIMRFALTVRLEEAASPLSRGIAAPRDRRRFSLVIHCSAITQYRATLARP